MTDASEGSTSQPSINQIKQAIINHCINQPNNQSLINFKGDVTWQQVICDEPPRLMSELIQPTNQPTITLLSLVLSFHLNTFRDYFQSTNQYLVFVIHLTKLLVVLNFCQ